ncbi:hypothetical protein I3271_07195 [Photobacterium leiognathi]|uniref:hypothetical protein n=1 Tax=Photobacterium leiognathi TaxID=553611 RepID=UPI001EDE482A|nr:hypothetical protein [Photobacterium leiognathi]MCG3884471.1 hypothetical protein [Photobacterium leiognathi]
MNTSELHYSNKEQKLQQAINDLFKDIGTIIDSKQKELGHTRTDLVIDGFYPYYLEQKCKVLFIGRESLGLSGLNYIDVLHHCYTEDQAIDGRNINQYRFHALMMYLAYALNNDHPAWEDVPEANEIAKTFATAEGVSFAFMNYSKLSNDSGNWQADWGMINKYESVLKTNRVNLYSQQISITDPDVILTMNLEDRLHNLGKLKALEYSDNASYFKLTIDDKSYLLIDLYHFAALKNMEKCFYLPVIHGVENHM